MPKRIINSDRFTNIITIIDETAFEISYNIKLK